MRSLIIVLFIFYLTYPFASSTLFSIQETLTVLCQQFPLISLFNNTDLQCARLRSNEGVSTLDFNLDNPTQIILFIIIDLPSSSISPIDIDINFDQSLVSPSSINEIFFSLLVTHSNFTINNQTTIQYTPYDIPIFLWQNSVQNTIDLIDLIQFENLEYQTDRSLCTWTDNQWNRLFNGNNSNNVSYVYFLKTTNVQLQFTLIDKSSESALVLSAVPSPYLNILYCIPYKLGITEIILIICFGVLFIGVVIIFSVLHYLKGGEDNRTRHFQLHHNHRRNIQEKYVRNHTKKVRRHSSTSTSSIDQQEKHI